MLTVVEHFFFTTTNETRNKTRTTTIPIITEIVDVDLGSIGFLVEVLVEVVVRIS